jgi:hypothetical protein
MPKLTTKYLNWNSILALNPVSRQKLAVYRSKMTFYWSKNGLPAVFMFFSFFLNLERILKKPWLPSGFGKPTGFHQFCKP